MKSMSSRSGQKAWIFAAAVVSTVAWLGVLGDTALAQTSPAAGMRGAAEAQQTAQGTAQASKITVDEAVQIALKTVPGKRTKKGVVIEKQRGKLVYVVEIIATEDGVETDVFIDPESGAVVGTEK